MNFGTPACAVVLAIASAVSLAGIAQDAPDSRTETRPESQAVVKPEPSPDELPALIATAQGSDLAARRGAFVRIGEIVDWIDWRFPDLTPLERRVGPAANWETRRKVRALIGSTSRAIASAIMADLGSSDRTPHEALVLVLKLGSEAPPVMPALTRLVMSIDENDVAVVTCAAEAVGGVEETLVPALVSELGRAESRPRLRAIDAIGELTHDPKMAVQVRPALAALTKALDDSEEEVRDGAASALFALGPAAAPARDALRRVALAAPATFAGRQAAAALHAIDPHDLAAVPGLMAQLGDPYWDWRRAADELRAIGPGAAAALPRLVDLAKGRGTRSPEESSAALRAIPAIDADGAVAVPLLIPKLGFADDDADFAVDELVRLAPRAPGALAWLRESLGSVPDARAVIERYLRSPQDVDATFDVFVALFEAAPSEATFRRARRHLGIDCRHGIVLLQKALATWDHASMCLAASTVDLFGPEAAPVVPQLRAMLGSSNELARHAAVLALQKADPEGQATIDSIIALLADSYEMVRVEAVRALGRLGRRASRASYSLTHLAVQGSEFERTWARRAVVQVGGEDPRLVEEIVSRLLEPGGLPVDLWGAHEYQANDLTLLEPPPLPAVGTLMATLAREGATPEAVHALLLLGRHGERAGPALSTIIERLKSPELNIRIAAAYAIGEIGLSAGDAVPALCTALGTARSVDLRDGSLSGGQLYDAIAHALGAIAPGARAALPLLLLGPGGYAESAIDQIAPPQRPKLVVAVAPGLTVCAGRWRDLRFGDGGIS